MTITAPAARTGGTLTEFFRPYCARCGQLLEHVPPGTRYCELCSLLLSTPHGDGISASPAEAELWKALELARPGLDPGSYLTRQHLVDLGPGSFYLDFACTLPGVKLGIEVDGWATHSSPSDIAADRKRQRLLELDGWTIIRFGGAEVWREPMACAEEVIAFIARELARAA
jgi:very-short-patch-repair endonuclease